MADAASPEASTACPRASVAAAVSPALGYRSAIATRAAAARSAVVASLARSAISACAASSGANRRSANGGTSLDGVSIGCSIASAIIAAAESTSPCASRSRASPGCGDQACPCASTKASSAPARSPLRSRMLPSSTSGHPNSRRIHGRSSSHAPRASCSASSHGPVTRSSSARCTRHRPLMPPKAAPRPQRSMTSVQSRARSCRASHCAAQISSQYIIPVVSGSTSPLISSAATSSSAASPSSTSPSAIRSRAIATWPITTAACTPSSPPSLIALSALSRDPSGSPHMKRS